MLIGPFNRNKERGREREKDRETELKRDHRQFSFIFLFICFGKQRKMRKTEEKLHTRIRLKLFAYSIATFIGHI